MTLIARCSNDEVIKIIASQTEKAQKELMKRWYLKVYSGIYSLYMRMFIAVFIMLSYLNSDTAVKHLLRWWYIYSNTLFFVTQTSALC